MQKGENLQISSCKLGKIFFLVKEKKYLCKKNQTYGPSLSTTAS